MAYVLVLGIGDPLHADDGAGVEAALRVLERTGERADVTVLDAGTLSFPLLPALRNADALIAIDATRGGGRPGELSVREGSEFDRFVARDGRSRSEVGLAELLEHARLAGHLPQRRVLIGVEAESVDWGLRLSAPVSEALPRCVAVALDFVERWHPAG
jgi:hydrogenase maturation protease